MVFSDQKTCFDIAGQYYHFLPTKNMFKGTLVFQGYSRTLVQDFTGWGLFVLMDEDVDIKA